jgi:hypothetical protein
LCFGLVFGDILLALLEVLLFL